MTRAICCNGAWRIFLCYTSDVILAESRGQVTRLSAEGMLLYSSIKVYIYAGMGYLYHVGTRYITMKFAGAKAWTYLQLPLWQWGAGNVYLLARTTDTQ